MEVTGVDEFIKEAEAVTALGGSTSAMACAVGLRSGYRKGGPAALWGTVAVTLGGAAWRGSTEGGDGGRGPALAKAASGSTRGKQRKRADGGRESRRERKCEEA